MTTAEVAEQLSGMTGLAVDDGVLAVEICDPKWELVRSESFRVDESGFLDDVGITVGSRQWQLEQMSGRETGCPSCANANLYFKPAT